MKFVDVGLRSLNRWGTFLSHEKKKKSEKKVRKKNKEKQKAKIK